uniref:Keratocan n=1 Tax=Eptatretus burgeri TaxID=7764 RepID=A0A8C4QBV2_EPTBU
MGIWPQLCLCATALLLAESAKKKSLKHKNVEEEEEPILYTGVQYYADCPPECNCLPNFETALNCESRRLRRVPNLPPRTLHLYLQHNRISALTIEPFSNATELRWLNLNDNRLTSKKVENKVFASIPHLLHLYIENNDLAKLPSKLPTTLQQLRLANNRISTVSPKDFARLKNLLLLDLSGNRLGDASFTSPLLTGLSSLIQLNLYRNQLTKLPPKLPSSLFQLYIERNAITTIPEGYFNDLKKLFSIRLNANAITDDGIPRGVFNISSLLELGLAHNQLTQVPDFPAHLEYLYLNHNQIKWVNVSSVCDGPRISADGPPRLRYFRIDDNHIKRLYTTELMICFPILQALIF